MNHKFTISMIIIVIAITTRTIEGSHFRGGLISWKYREDKVDITYRLSYTGSNCGDSLQSGEGSLSCETGCDGTLISPLSYYCTDSSGDENWKIGQRTVEVTLDSSSDNFYRFRYADCCWISLVEGGSNWSLMATVNLSVRSDTGLINNPPICSMQPVVRMKQSCSYSMKIPVVDEDGDFVKCRWATSLSGVNECGGVCSGLSNSILDEETCELSYNATGVSGWYVAALQIEDFASRQDTNPLSSVPLQFLVYIYSSSAFNCDSKPVLEPTVADGSIIHIVVNTNYLQTIIASSSSSIAEINTVSPLGMTKSELLVYGTSNNKWYINVTWTPTETQVGTHIFCYTAFDNNREASDQECIRLVVVNDIDECSSNPCKNGATCNNQVNGYSCACADGFTDTHCQKDIDECSSNPCQNGAMCNDQVNGYHCMCADGFTDTHCQTDIDECSSNQCQNKATCYDRVNGYNCTCPDKFTDTHYINECTSNPCQNGAICNDQVNGYSCTCADGFTDTHCQIDIDECSSNPCENGGTCNDHVNGYHCTCADGFTNTHCQIDIDECSSNPCQNEATCNDQVNGYDCTCADGFTDTHCHTDIDECSSNPCQNGANCIDQINGYDCTCVDGFTDTHCQTDINECSSHPCQNGATCNDQVNGYICTCADGFNDEHCQTDINECSSNPCQNGATCNDLVNGYYCTCADGFTDTHCQIDINECSSNPCENGATCNDQVNRYHCTCADGFTDTHCQTDIDECLSNPCENGATCNDQVNGYNCTCADRFIDIHCETDVLDLCPEDVDKIHTLWGHTKFNTSVIIPCTGGSIGNVLRYCDVDRQWQEPDYSGCISVQIYHLKEQSSLLKSGVGTEEIVNKILNDLTSITYTMNALKTGDLSASAGILYDIAENVAEFTDRISENQFDAFTGMASRLLDGNNIHGWSELKCKVMGDITYLVKAVMLYSKTCTHIVDSDKPMLEQKDNLVIQVGKIGSKEIIAPDTSQASQSWMLESATHIKLPANIFNGPTSYSSTFYRNLSKSFPGGIEPDEVLQSSNGSYGVNSIIAAFTTETTQHSLDYPVVVKFEHLSENFSKPICAFWNFEALNACNGAWSTSSSRVVESTDTYTICEYSQTGNFALLMSPGKASQKHKAALSLISVVGCGISIVFLVITIFIYFKIWRYVEPDSSQILMHLCISMIITYIVYLAGITRTENEVVCTSIAIALQYILLVYLTLMLVGGIQVALMVILVFYRSFVRWLLAACWVVPAIIVSSSAVVSKLDGYGSSEYCWLSLESKLIWAILGPALLVVVINLILLVIVMNKLKKSKGLAAKTLKEKSRPRILIICILLPLLGITWMLGAYYVKEDVLVLHYLFSICNSLQGFFIFLFHCIFCNQVGQGYLQCMRKRKESRTLSSTDSINISYQRRLNQLKIYPDKHIPHFPNEEYIKPSGNREEPFPDYPKETTQNVENSIYNFNSLARTVYYDSKYDNRGYSPFDIPK